MVNNLSFITYHSSLLKLHTHRCKHLLLFPVFKLTILVDAQDDDVVGVLVGGVQEATVRRNGKIAGYFTLGRGMANQAEGSRRGVDAVSNNAVVPTIGRV